MVHIKNIEEMVNYCEMVLSKDNPELKLLRVLFNILTEEEMIGDYKRTLNVYYHYLKLAEITESYNVAQLLFEAKNKEIQQYNELLLINNKKNYIKELQKIDNEKKLEYLNK